MPELPEVETIRRIVEAHLTGHTLRSFEVSLPKVLRQSVISDPEMLVGRTVINASRRGKILDIAFDGDLDLLVHFKLAGQLAIDLPGGERLVAGHPVPKPDGHYPHRATHARLGFDDGRVAWYSDVRQFGWMNILPAAEVRAALDLLALGPEATDPIDADRLAALFARRSVPVKAVLLDQHVLAGLGNIYVDEVLFRAAIHPAIPAKAIPPEGVHRIAANVPPVLAEGIRQGGATIIHGKAYPENGFPAVHGREGEACNRCGETIAKIRVAGRGTYLCPVCQPAP
ncbi:MAG: bifunctional DNA-formamidopyrimidine glycosylase/DNA-(apurinic or apyrimidinic site) lyase [Chloroflexota bacterium]|nr:bifunctional DNA-formamidopyrimidine glycosylase/DNA-(apurinic or apyrimidinic site) lyase [Chloroflexota bacterium]